MHPLDILKINSWLEIVLRIHMLPQKKIYTHITCATNTTNVRAVFTAVKDIIIRGSLAAAGLV